MSKERDARDLALREYDKFMEKYKAGVEAGDMRLMQHMLKLEADKIRTQTILDAIEKPAAIDKNLYDFEEKKMKLQMNSDEYRRDQAREEAFIKMATKDTTKEEVISSPISIGDPDKMDAYRFDPANFGQIAPIKNKTTKKVVKKETPKQQTGIVIDPETGKKVYKGPKLKSRKVINGKEWDETHPDFHGNGG